MPIQGLRTDENFLTTQRPQNWRQTMLLLYPNSSEIAKAPLTALTSLMKSESTDDPVFHWFQKTLDARRLLINTNVLVGDTQLTIDPTYTSGTDFATANSVNYDPIELNNYCQIFRSTLSITRTAQKTRLRTGDAVTEAKRECLEYFSVDMERAFWFNGRKQLTSFNGQPARFTAGIFQHLKDGAAAKVVAAPPSGLITMDWLEQYTEILFRYGSSEKMAFGSNLALLALQQAIRKNSYWRIESGIKEYGLTVSRFITPFGELVFKTHPLFNQMQCGITAGAQFYSVANNVYILDMQNIRYKYVDDVKYEKDLTPIGLDGLKSGYLAECGLELHHAPSHGVWTGIQGGAT